MKNFVLLLFFTLFSLSVSAQHYVGGDISLLQKYLDNNAPYYSYDGTTRVDPLSFFSQEGLNCMRVRLFVNPNNATAAEKGEGVCQDLEYVKQLGKKIKDAGFAFMLDFHYSDTWADPAKQWTPKEWLNLTDTQLAQKIYDYTKECLTQCVASGATPDIIQTGNEISYGMLWGAVGTTSPKKYYAGQDGYERLTSFLKQASMACREVCPQAKIILHTERVEKTSYCLQFYQDMKNANIDYDIIGTSYYPYWHGGLNQLETTLTSLESSFPEKKIMIVETGYYNNWQPSNVSYNFSSTWAISPAGQKSFLTDLINKLNEHKNVIGLLWWFMETNDGEGNAWSTQHVLNSWYNCGLFDNASGKALEGISVLRNFLTAEQAGIPETISYDKLQNTPPFNVAGQRVNADYKGIIIKNGRKILSNAS